MRRTRAAAVVLIASLMVAGCASGGGDGGATDQPPSVWLHPLEAYEGGAKAAEDRYIDALAEFFGRPVEPGETPRRGTHAVGTCTAASFEIYDIAADPDLPDELALGVFEGPGTYDARVRFSNGHGTPSDPDRGFDDKDYDARALAIAMTYRDSQRQDFVLQNSPIFPVWPLEGFLLTVQLGIARAQGQTAEEFIAQLPAEQRAVLLHVLSHVRRFHRAPGVEPETFTPMPDAYRLETYWSGKAHQLGVGGVPVKYIARPCNGNGTYVPTKAIDFADRSNDFLQAELVRHLDRPLADEPPACFDFYLQPLQAAVMTGPEGRVLPEDQYWMWVEDTTLEWKETEARPYRVGRITLRGPALPAEVCDDPANFINSSINTLPEHTALGRISRAEQVAARASVERRSQR
jgi:hypothetical protein